MGALGEVCAGGGALHHVVNVVQVDGGDISSPGGCWTICGVWNRGLRGEEGVVKATFDVKTGLLREELIAKQVRVVKSKS